MLIFSPTEIIEKVKMGGKDPFRPMVPKDQCSPQLRDLMSHCLTEDPHERPEFTYIKKICRLVSGLVFIYLLQIPKPKIYVTES